MASKLLSIHGYGILKNDNTELITLLKEELTMTPNVSFSLGGDSTETKSFPIYTESEKRLYIPRYYGLQKLGLPYKCTLSLGEERPNMMFQGILREIQIPFVNKFIEAANDPLKKGGIISVPCGYGKTIMSVYIACHFKRKTLFVSHKNFLNQQFADTVKEFVPDAKIGIIKQSKVDVEDKDFVVASLQSLIARDYDINIFKEFGLVIYDECHHLSAECFSKSFRKLNVNIALGLSATLNRKDGLGKIFEYHIGKSVHKITNKEKTLLNVQVHKYYVPDIQYSQNKMLRNGRPNCTAMINNICAYKPRTEYVLNILKDILVNEPQRKVLILSERRQHLVDFENLIIASITGDVGYYVGGMKQDALDESSKKQIILATYSMAAEGLNIPSLNTLIFASPISDIQQSIGRILRQRPSERTYVPLCIDVWDEFSLFKRKSSQRLKYYTSNGYDIQYFIEGEALSIDDNEDKKKIKYEFIEDD
jgi:superfamily II DNA or RNA helicase